MNKTALVVIPTYNEAENISELLENIRATSTGYALEILVVDSHSPDGTGEKLEAMKNEFPGLSVLHQDRKMGLASAYLDGFRFFQENRPNRYDAILTMDADFSHHPRYLPLMLQRLEQCDLVVGSRYVPGGKLKNWPLWRRVLSRCGNLYAKVMTGGTVNDLTSGFHCFRASVLDKVLQHKINAEGYAFLVELKFRAAAEGFKIQEIPIVFADRTKGSSKISQSVVREAALVVLKLSCQKWIKRCL